MPAKDTLTHAQVTMWAKHYKSIKVERSYLGGLFESSYIGEGWNPSNDGGC